MNIFAAGALSIGLLIVLGAAIILLRWKGRFSSHLRSSVKRTLLMVSLPKELPGFDEKTWTPEKLREQIGLMESFITSIAGLKVKELKKNKVLGERIDHVACEIAAMSKEIFFFMSVSPLFLDHVKQNIEAAFPSAHIETVPDYNIFQENGKTAGASFRFTRSFALPIKTYAQIEGDPLNHITNALSKLEEHEGAVIQYVIRSAHKKWHKIGSKTAHEMQQGKHFKEAVKKAERGIVGKAAAAVVENIKSNRESKKEKESPKIPKPAHQTSPQEAEMIKGMEQKASKAGLEVNIRVVVSTQSSARSETLLSNIVNAFSQFNLYEYGNKLDPVIPKHPEKTIHDFIFRRYAHSSSIILNTEEFASLFHFPLPSTETPNIHWQKAREAPAPVNLPEEGVLIGKNVYRGKETPVKIDLDDRRRHVYIIGMTGVGKTALLLNMAAEDIREGRGVAVIDPHGDLAENLLSLIPPSRADDVIYFNPADTERPVGLNMLDAETAHEKDFAIQEMIMIFYKLVTDPAMIGPMFEHNMRNAMLTLMSDKENPGTITEIPRIFTDTEFQRFKLKNVTDPMVRAFWEKEMAKTSDFHKSEMLGYLISKVGRFVENSMMRNIIGQPKSGIDFKKIMNEGKILIVNLSKGRVGEINSSLLGLIIVSKLEIAAFSRAGLEQEERKDFFLYIDEFQNYTTDSIATILSEARKYRLNLTMAHQYLGQLAQGNDTKIRDAVLGNVGTMISFRIGVEDTETMKKQFEPVFSAYDLINVDRHNAFVRTLVSNAATRPFSIMCYPPEKGEREKGEKLKELSRLRYGRPVEDVEQEIIERSKLGAVTITQPQIPPQK